MARYRLPDGSLVDTSKSVDAWNEATRWDGSNRISIPTGSQWVHETLRKMKNGRYLIERISRCDGVPSSARWVDQEEAARWLLLNNHELPEDLRDIAEVLID